MTMALSKPVKTTKQVVFYSWIPLKPGCAEGWYCDLRLAWLEAQLADANGRDVYLFMHHPPFNIGIPTLDRIALVQQVAFAAVVRPHTDNIKHLFLGHIHRPLCGHWLSISMSSLRGMNHQVGLDFKTTASLPGNFEAPAYAIVLFKHDRLIVHTHDFLDDSPKFDLANSPVQGLGCQETSRLGRIIIC